MEPKARWTLHALDALAEREIDRIEAERTLEAPEFIVLEPRERSVLMRRYFDASLARPMLMRLIVEDTSNGRIVVTVYKTSRIRKYLKGFLP